MDQNVTSWCPETPRKMSYIFYRRYQSDSLLPVTLLTTKTGGRHFDIICRYLGLYVDQTQQDPCNGCVIARSFTNLDSLMCLIRETVSGSVDHESCYSERWCIASSSEKAFLQHIAIEKP